MFKKSIVFAVVLSLTAALPASANLDAAAKFFEGLSVKSDLRVRYEGIFDDEVSGNSASYGYGGNLNDRSRGRYRLRIGFTKRVNDEVKVGVRFATGGQGTTSTNQSFSDNFANDEFDVDLAYLTWSPAWVSGLDITLGKMNNPFFTNGSLLVWDSDITPEGAAQSYEFSLSNINFTYTQAQFFITENSRAVNYVPLAGGVSPSNTDNPDAYLLGFQFGGDYDGSTVDLGLHGAYYNFNHMRGSAFSGNGNTNVWTTAAASAARQEFNVLDIIGYVKFDLGLPVQITANWTRNLDCKPVGVGYTDAAGNTFVADRTEEDNAFLIRLDINKASNPGDWAFSYTYATIEADAVPGSLKDSDFEAVSLGGYGTWNTAGNGGRARNRGTNVEGHRFQLNYVLLKNTTLSATYQITDAENEALARVQDGIVNGTDPYGVAGVAALSGWNIPQRQLLQLDMNVKW